MGDAPSSMQDISDQLFLVLELIFLRLPSPAGLVRAATVCKLWRRAIADPGFLRLFRALHAPAVAGDYFNRFLLFNAETSRGANLRPSFVPSPSTATAATIDARHFSLDFLPDGVGRPQKWDVLDNRGSLLLMLRKGPGSLHKIPPPPDFGPERRVWGTYLVDGDADEAGGCISMSNFRVLCEFYSGGVAHAGVFFAGAGGAAGPWTEKAIAHIVDPARDNRRCLGHAGGSWYFHVKGRTVAVLDGRTGEYSSFVLPATEDWPPNLRNYNFCVTDGRDGEPRIVSVADGTSTMKVFARLDGGRGEWAPVKRVGLPEAASGLPGYEPSLFERHRPCFWTRGPGFVILVLSKQPRVRWAFVVDLESMEVEPAADDAWGMLYRCELPWPPPLNASYSR
ncbi:hypothetical protein ACP4OV_005537 [Aristida adscensionis]